MPARLKFVWYLVPDFCKCPLPLPVYFQCPLVLLEIHLVCPGSWHWFYTVQLILLLITQLVLQFHLLFPSFLALSFSHFIAFPLPCFVNKTLLTKLLVPLLLGICWVLSHFVLSCWVSSHFVWSSWVLPHSAPFCLVGHCPTLPRLVLLRSASFGSVTFCLFWFCYVLPLSVLLRSASFGSVTSCLFRFRYIPFSSAPFCSVSFVPFHLLPVFLFGSSDLGSLI